MKKSVLVLSMVLMLSRNTFADTPSQWAADSVSSAYELGLVPDRLMGDYGEDISRADFCSLCANALRACGIDVDNVSSVSFNDTEDEDVLFCAALGIVSGTGNGRFEPNRAVTRQEAARLLCNALDVIRGNIDKELYFPHIFADGKNIASWARNEVYAAYHTGIMQGVSGSNFDPQGSYTREQAISTFLRLYNLKDSEGLNVNSEFYPAGEYAGNINSEADGRYFLDMAYLWNKVKSEYKPQYIDSYGNTYSAEEKGYVYPVGDKYLRVLMSIGAGVSRESIINSSGEEVLSNVMTVNSLNGDLADVTAEEGLKLYDLTSGEAVTVDGMPANISYAGCGMYYATVEGKDGDCYLNSDLKRVTDYVYAYASRGFLNNLAAVVRKDGTIEVIDTEGNIIRTRKIDMSRYSVYDIYGTNVILQLNDGTGMEVLRAVSGIYVKGYNHIDFLPNGQMYAYNYNENGKTYLLSLAGEQIADVEDMGYNYFSTANGNDDLFIGGKADGTCDVLDSDLRVIARGLSNGYILTDGGGVYCGATSDSSLVVFTYDGAVLGEIKKDSKIDDFDFINGLIRIKANSIQEYYLPSGEKVDFIK